MNKVKIIIKYISLNIRFSLFQRAAVTTLRILVGPMSTKKKKLSFKIDYGQNIH